MSVDEPVKFLPGRNLFLKREVFTRIGGFPEHLVTCEDYWFTELASRQGPLWYTSETNYLHLGEDRNYADMFKKEIWRGQSNLISIRGRQIPPDEWPSFIVPLAVTALAILTPPLCLLESFTAASAAAPSRSA